LLALNAFCSGHKALGISEPRALIRIRESAVIFPPITAITAIPAIFLCVVGLAPLFLLLQPGAIDHRPPKKIISACMAAGSTRAFLL
jgi:hypothetical protein